MGPETSIDDAGRVEHVVQVRLDASLGHGVWLRAASEELGVRLGWLVSGDGQPNQAWDDLAGEFARAITKGLSGLGRSVLNSV